jgi:hypothetical protein
MRGADPGQVVSATNSGVLDLFELHTAAQSRLEAGVRIPMCYTEQVPQCVFVGVGVGGGCRWWCL